MSAPIVGPRTELRPLQHSDEAAFLAAAAASRALHHPWFSCPQTDVDFQALVARQGDSFAALLLVDRESGLPAGVFNYSQIFMRAFRSAYLGYGAFSGFAGSGRMTEGLQLALRWGFGRIGLHRVEANIRPENVRSIALVRRVGFEREGFSKNYLFLDGAWRDHERWAIREEIFTPPPSL